MTEAARAARREYKKKWQRENADKVKQYQANYWNRKAQEAAAAAQDHGGGDPQEDTTA